MSPPLSNSARAPTASTGMSHMPPVWASAVGVAVAVAVALEAVMNSMRDGLGMRETGDRGKPGQPENPHSHGVFIQVHNTL